MPNSKTCSRCGKKPTTGSHAWCSGCIAAAKSEQTKTALVREYVRGFAAGADAMVETLSAEFGRFSEVRVTMDEAAGFVRRAPRPKPQPNCS